MARIDRQQIDPLYLSKLVQDPIQVTSSHMGRSDKIIQISPIICEKRLQTSQETGSGKGTELGNSRFLLLCFTSADFF